MSHGEQSDCVRDGTPEPREGAFRDMASHLRLWLVAVLGLGADLWTKNWAFSHLKPLEKVVIVPNLVSFQRSLNTGALFGLGKGWTPLFIVASVLALLFVLSLFISSTRERRSLHVALGLVLAGALGNLYDRAFQIADVVSWTAKGQQYRIEGRLLEQTPHQWVVGHWPEKYAVWQKIPTSWEPGVRQQGVVRDFVKMEPKIPIGSRAIELWPWVFNVADVLLVAGVGLLLLNFWWDRRAAAGSRAIASEVDSSGPPPSSPDRC